MAKLHLSFRLINMSHGRATVTGADRDSEEDPIIRKLKSTGCLDKHYSVLVTCLNTLY